MTIKEFATAVAGLGLQAKDGPFAVAVSGGPDSMALSLLMAGWGEATYLTFDHGLRPESAAEAGQVAGWLKARGLKHHVLTWQGAKPESNLQAEARAARYQALEGWCRDNNVKYLFLAHTLEDQAETFLIRLFRGSGIDGLSAMQAISPPNSGGGTPQLVRPLLGIKKERLVNFLEDEKQPWIEDPSNENTEFTRIKVRQLLAASDIEGSDAETLAKTAARMTRVKHVLDRETKDVLDQSLEVCPEGFARLDRANLLKADEEIGLRALSRTLMAVGGSIYPQRLSSLERLYAGLRDKTFKGATLAGCQVMPEKNGAFIICREPADVSEEVALKAGQSTLWDNRFMVSLTAGSGVVRKLGEAGWKQLLAENPGLKDLVLPFPVKIGLPVLVADDTVREAPFLGVSRKKPAFTARFLPLGEK